ncbi:hypothetical protein, partial [Bacteroides caecigallinarum]|uniref:hypothetical protein n=1 Tax=Bacteroides caecigallinarum TaxID=1411144 RepID=UPI00195AA7AF
GILNKEPPRAEPHAWWWERSENESRKKTTSFSSYSITIKLKDDHIIPKFYIIVTAFAHIATSSVFGQIIFVKIYISLCANERN